MSVSKPPSALSETTVVQLEKRNISYLFRDTHRSFRRIMKERIAPHGITVAMWTQLWELWHQDGLTQSEIARRIMLEKPSVNATIAKMEAQGIIERRPDPHDRREKRVFLTEKGWALHKPLVSMTAQINAEVLNELNDMEGETLMQLLSSVNMAARRIADSER